jgi:hypothetical protein
MSHPEDLIGACQARLSREGVSDAVDAAGAFALQDNYKAIAAGGAASSLLPGGDNPLVAGLEGAGAIEASRQANAAAHGVSERMMVCVTDANIYVFALRSPMGNDPGDLLATFDRAGAEVEVKKFLGSKRLHIQEGEQKMFLQGATARISPDAGGDKSVLEALG